MNVRGEEKENALIKKREAERWINTLFDLCKRVAWVQGERTVWLCVLVCVCVSFRD